jgi:hypothetical protein
MSEYLDWLRMAGEPVLLIHGTWANSSSTNQGWWRPGSKFCSTLDAALERMACRARCWAPTRFVLDDRPPIFAWTGANRESERRTGSDALADLIGWLEKTRTVYHIVAHSHGGNVVLGALRQVPKDPEHLGAVIFGSWA